MAGTLGVLTYVRSSRVRTMLACVVVNDTLIVLFLLLCVAATGEPARATRYLAPALGRGVPGGARGDDRDGAVGARGASPTSSCTRWHSADMSACTARRAHRRAYRRARRCVLGAAAWAVRLESSTPRTRERRRRAVRASRHSRRGVRALRRASGGCEGSRACRADGPCWGPKAD
jgi:hypothetical protein